MDLSIEIQKPKVFNGNFSLDDHLMILENPRKALRYGYQKLNNKFFWFSFRILKATSSDFFHA